MNTLVKFSGFTSLEKEIDSSQPFVLEYLVGSEYDKKLRKLARQCIDASSVLGVIFLINKEERDFETLFFLKPIVELFLSAHKPVSVAGVPECVIRRMLGAYLYMKYRQQTIVLESTTQTSGGQVYMVEECEGCIDRGNCAGLGQRNYGRYKPRTKMDSSYIRLDIKRKEFGPENALLNTRHEAFIQHCHDVTSPTTYRKIYYTTNIDYESPHSYQHRFIYQCDYLSPAEYQLEYSFLKRHVLNPSYIELFEAISNIDKTLQIAYSLAEKEGRTRESFYMFATKQHGATLLSDLGISYQPPRSPDMRFLGAGIDLVDKEVESHKIYHQSPKNFITNYLTEFGVDASNLSHNWHYVVLRLDRKQELVSYKIEILFAYQDLPLLRPLLRDYDYFQSHLAQSGHYNLSVEIENNRISKVNVYHRDQLPG